MADEVLDRSDWSMRSASDAAVALDSASGGLTDDEAERRRAVIGPNEIQGEAGKGKFSILVTQLRGVLTYVLVAAAVISAFLGDWIEAVAIVAIIILNAVMGYVQEARAEEAMADLKQAWQASLEAEEKFKDVLQRFTK